MNKLEILNDIKTKKLAIAEIMDTLADEKRELKNVEKITLESLKAEITELEKRMSASPEIEVQKTVEPVEKFNLLSAIRDYKEGRGMADATKRMIEEGKRSFEGAGISVKDNFVLPLELRTQSTYNVTTATEGKELVGEDRWAPLGDLRNNLVLAQAGAKIIGGLKGDVALPKMAATNVGWALETANASDGSAATSELTMSPKRLTCYVDVSNLLLQQTSFDAQQLLIDNINKSVAEKLEASILSTFTGSTTQPEGLFNGLAGSTGTTTTYTAVVGLESTLDASNAATGSLAYIVHPTIKGKMKTTAAFTNGSVPIMQGTEANGYPVYTTAAMPAGTNSSRIAAFANWSDLVIGQWGGVSMTIDPYSQAIGGKTRLVVNFYVNWLLTRDESLTATYLK
jgi:HK97 family phage major capsid protein